MSGKEEGIFLSLLHFYLQNINPCLHETERQTVESLLYIRPFDPLDASLGKLLGNGCLKVYDMDQKCFESNINISDSGQKSVTISTFSMQRLSYTALHCLLKTISLICSLIILKLLCSLLHTHRDYLLQCRM